MTQYLKPRSVDLPSQGQFEFRPHVKMFDADSPAALELELNNFFSIQSLDADNKWVVEDIQYAVGPPPAPRHLALVRLTQVIIA